MKNFYIEGGIKGDYIVGMDAHGNHMSEPASTVTTTNSSFIKEVELKHNEIWAKEIDWYYSGRAEYCWKYSSRRKNKLMEKYKEKTLLRNRIVVALFFTPFVLAIAWGIYTDYIHGFFAGVGAGYCLYKIFTGLTEKWPIEGMWEIKDRVKKK